MLRSWAICSGVIGELSLATPAKRTVKDKTRAERRERIAEKDIGDGRWDSVGSGVLMLGGRLWGMFRHLSN